MTWLRKSLVAACLLLATAVPSFVLASSDLLICDGGKLLVHSTSPEDAELACMLAMKAKERIVKCGLKQSRPINIFVTQEIEHTIGECLATYDCSNDILRVIDPALISGSLEAEDPYAVLPTEILFQAVISHEMAHALLEQSSTGVDLAFVDHEYVAAAMELDILEPQWRQALIDAAPVSLPPKEGLISALIYGFEPRKFATNAWQYFDSEPDGCERIRRIATGDFTFSDQLR
jgi:hypothetical protein